MIDVAKRGIMIGEESHGSTGTLLLGKLPVNRRFAICTRFCTYPDGKEFINIGVKPHIYEATSIEDYKNGVDNVLNKGLLELRKTI